MANILLVGIGGLIGSVLRYLLSMYVQQAVRGVQFPWGTLVVNLIGCFVIGLLASLGEARGTFTDASRAFVFVGILGGFTTFSSFGNETFNLIRGDQVMNAILNIAASVVLGLFAVWLGRTVAAMIWR